VNDFLLIVCVEVFERKRGGWLSDDGGGVLMRKPHCSLLTAHCSLLTAASIPRSLLWMLDTTFASRWVSAPWTSSIESS
jgi:hypothetical protein